MGLDMNRRRFVGLMGLGSVSVAGLATLAGCAPVKEASNASGKINESTPAPKPVAAAATTTPMADMNHAASPATTTSTASSASDQMTPDQMDAADLAQIKLFLKNQESPITPGKGGKRLEYEMDGDTKVFKLTAQKLKWTTAPDQEHDAYGYNGALPGPEIRVTEGDKVRVILTNNMDQSTTIHFHGLHGVPNAMDGVGNITQPPVKPGASFTYEFVAKPSGTHMYHTHIHAMRQMGMGLLGALIIEPKDKSSYPKYDREYVMVLNDTFLGFTINGKGFPATDALTAKKGERVLVRFMNEGNMSHPMHLHGMPMQVYARDGYPLPQPYMCDTVDVAPGNRYEVFIEATDVGVWAFHCHILTHAEGDAGMFGLVTALVVTES